MNKVHDIGRAYLAASLSIIPILADGSKRPAILWKSYQERKPTDVELKLWFENSTGHGIGIICGQVSGGLEVLDFDDISVYKPWFQLVNEIGGGSVVQKLPIVRTPNGGHVFFRCPEAIQGNQKLAQRKMPDGKIEVLIETRGQGGYVIAPGSPIECHPDKKPYTVVHGSLSDIPVISVAERAMLFDCARALNEHIDERNLIIGDSQPIQLKTGVRPGDDFNARAQWNDIMSSVNWSLSKGGNDASYWRKPGDGKPGHHATTNWKGSDLLYIFSTSAPPFEAGKAYSKFAAYTLLNHSGDYKQAAHALKGLGYGASKTNTPQLESNDDYEKVKVQTWPRLNGAALYGLAGEIVKESTRESEADPAAVLITTLVHAGAAFGAQPYVGVGETKHSPRLITVIVGASGRARKGTSTNPVLRIFEAAEKNHGLPKLQVVYGPLSTGEGLVHAVRDQSEKLKKDNEPEDLGVGDKRLLAIEGEFGAPLKAMQREGNTLSAIIRTAWDHGNIAPLTKRDRIKTTGAHICIVGHITRNELAGLLAATDIWNGFANRFLWVCARRQGCIAFPSTMSEELVNNIAQKLADVIKTAHTLNRIDLHVDTKKVWKDLYPTLTKDEPGTFGIVTARGEAQVMRVALTYALLDKSDTILPEHLKAALAVWDYCRASARYIFGNAETDPDANRILHSLKGGEKTQTQLNDLFHGHLSSTRLKTVLSDLEAMGKIDQHKEGGGRGKGKAVTFWNLSPGFVSSNEELEEIEE